MSDEFRNHLERMLKADERLLLGYLIWYSVRDVRVDHNTVIRELVAAGIDTNLPLPPKDADVFRRVCTEAARKRVPTADEGVFENYLLRDLNADNDGVYRRVVVERVDGKGRKLGYEQLYDVTFDKATSKISNRKLGPDNATAAAIVDDVRINFDRQRGCLNAYAIREWIRHFVLGLSATQVRPGGGVYFVSEAHHDRVVALEQFCKAIGGEVDFHYLPLIDDDKQRDMLRRAFEAESVDEVDNLISEITEIRSAGRKISQARYEEFLAKYHSLSQKTTDYGELLEESLDGTKSRLQILMRSMVELTEKHVRF